MHQTWKLFHSVITHPVNAASLCLVFQQVFLQNDSTSSLQSLITCRLCYVCLGRLFVGQSLVLSPLRWKKIPNIMKLGNCKVISCLMTLRLMTFVVVNGTGSNCPLLQMKVQTRSFMILEGIWSGWAKCRGSPVLVSCGLPPTPHKKNIYSSWTSPSRPSAAFLHWQSHADGRRTNHALCEWVSEDAVALKLVQ